MPPSDAPLMTTTGGTLVVVRRQGRPPGPPRQPHSGRAARLLAPYVGLFSQPGALAFSLSGILARLPMGMFGVAAVVMVASTRGSYALAGAVAATSLAVSALVAPFIGRAVDRHGQARVAVPAVLCAVGAHLALVVCVRGAAPDWALFVCAAAACTAPNTGGMSRARWAHLYRGSDTAQIRARHTANSFEQAADELCFMLGPVIAVTASVAFFPEAGTLCAAALLLTGVLLFAAQRRTEPPVTTRVLTGGSAVRAPGMLALVGTFLCTGTIFGSMEVATVAFADASGLPGVAGFILALQAAGSCAAGLAFGLLRPSGPLQRRFVRCVAGMAVLMTLPLLAASSGGLLLLTPALLFAGMATAPTMVTSMTLVQRLVPSGQLNEGMTLAVTALLAGIAGGAAVGGSAAEHLPGTWPFALPLLAALAAAVVAALAFGRRTFGPGVRPVSQENGLSG